MVTMGGHSKVAFLGLGAMGLGMATSLLRAGFTVRGFDVSSTWLSCYFASVIFMTVVCTCLERKGLSFNI
jgi:6-phosphogluconate dehydrogenase (decarboxylating)